MVEGFDEGWESIRVCKVLHTDQFAFISDDLDTLCEGFFSSAHIEILEFIDRTMRTSFIRRETNNHFYINIRFSTNHDIQKFFRDIRWFQRQVNFLFLALFSQSLVSNFPKIDYSELNFCYSNPTHYKLKRCFNIRKMIRQSEFDLSLSSHITTSSM